MTCITYHTPFLFSQKGSAPPFCHRKRCAPGESSLITSYPSKRGNATISKFKIFSVDNLIFYTETLSKKVFCYQASAKNRSTFALDHIHRSFHPFRIPARLKTKSMFILRIPQNCNLFLFYDARYCIQFSWAFKKSRYRCSHFFKSKDCKSCATLLRRNALYKFLSTFLQATIRQLFLRGIFW